ncbi:MAG: gamma-glutamyl-gamma-aminobutyrate hydrolase family protein [Bdellovibrionaceae bacterium]|nr:gamma-glutamyl-gamma-aminobutyrate hydrolase family protein [Pseudobdellovibrionaceae bacterium]
MALHRLLLGIFSLLIFAPGAFARGVELYAWSPGTTLAPLIIPVRASETPEQAAHRYLRELGKNPDLMELFEGRLPHLPSENFKVLPEPDRERRALMIANNPRALQPSYRPLRNLIHAFKQQQNDSYILPMTADLGLSRAETLDFFQQISEKFPLLVPMGGADVDPHFYGQQTVHARDLNPTRDQFELQLIKHYVAQEKGFVLGICRGSQLTAVALGYQLLQDVPYQKGSQVPHANDWHPIQVHATTHNLLKDLAGSADQLRVNSLHHQSVVHKEGGPLELAAQSADGITEATEFKNGRGLLLQFHPELMENELGERILKRVIQQKNKVMRIRCGKAFGD